MPSGYDRYLDFQYRMSGGFFTHLFQAIAVADGDNTAALEKGYPEEVDAYRVWTTMGAQALLAFISHCHGCRPRFIEEYGLDEFPDPVLEEHYWNPGEVSLDKTLGFDQVEKDLAALIDDGLAGLPIPYPLVFMHKEVQDDFEIRAWQVLGAERILVEIDNLGESVFDANEIILAAIGKVYQAEKAERASRVTKS